MLFVGRTYAIDFTQISDVRQRGEEYQPRGRIRGAGIASPDQDEAVAC